MFTAYHRDEFLFSSDRLDEVLGFLADVMDPSLPEDGAVWHHGRVVAVVLSTGTILRLDRVEVPLRFVPADLARLDETAA